MAKQEKIPQNSKFDRYFENPFPKQPQQSEVSQFVQNVMGMEMRGSIREADIPDIIKDSLYKSLDNSLQVMFEISDRLTIHKQIVEELDRLFNSLYPKKERDFQEINIAEQEFLKIISKASSNVLAITLSFLKSSGTFIDFIEFLDYVLKTNPDRELNLMMDTMNTKKAYIDPRTRLGKYLYEITPLDISGIYEGTKDEHLISAWKTRINFCIGIVGYLRQLRDMLKNYKKYAQREA